MRTKLQLLFGNPYQARSRLLSVEGSGKGPRCRTMESPRLPPALWTLCLAGTLLGAAVGGASAASHSGPGVVLLPSPWSAYDTGRVQVIFPAPLPSVELLQDANGSTGAALYLDHVDEIAPGGATHPLVVMTASPETLADFNHSVVSPQPLWPLSLAAEVAVQTAGVPLWSAPPASPANGSPEPEGNTSIAVSYSLSQGPGATQGVTLNWTVSNWPWLSSADLLALEFRLVVLGGTDLKVCTGGGGGAAIDACPGTSLSVGSIYWSPDATSVVGHVDASAVAVVAWGSSATEQSGATLPVLAGTYEPASGEGHILLTTASGGASHVNGTTAFYLSAPLPPLVLGPYHAEPLVYLGAMAGFAALVASGWVGYRRRERRILRSL